MVSVGGRHPFHDDGINVRSKREDGWIGLREWIDAPVVPYEETAGNGLRRTADGRGSDG